MPSLLCVEFLVGIKKCSFFFGAAMQNWPACAVESLGGSVEGHE